MSRASFMSFLHYLSLGVCVRAFLEVTGDVPTPYPLVIVSGVAAVLFGLLAVVTGHLWHRYEKEEWTAETSQFDRFFAEHGKWSQATFGPDNVRGPIGPLKHLAKEAVEAQEAWESGRFDARAYCEELADCFLLLCDATRRSGLDATALLNEAQWKLEKNQKREWPPYGPTRAEEPVEHLKPDYSATGLADGAGI